MKHRITGAALSLSVLCQLAAGALPALQVRAAEAGGISLETFAARVQETVRADADKELFREIVYDPDNGTLSADGGAPQTEAGGLSVRGGRLMLDTGADAGHPPLWRNPGTRARRRSYPADRRGYPKVRRLPLAQAGTAGQNARL